MISRIDEKVTARYADIQRRSHEDFAGVDLRRAINDLKGSMIRWMVSLFAIQTVFFVVLAWAREQPWF